MIKSSNFISKMLEAINNKVVKSNSNKTNKIVKILSQFKKSKNTKFEILMYTNIGAMKKLIFLTLDAKKTFIYLNKIFIKASIF